jgi:hypothetical protein
MSKMEYSDAERIAALEVKVDNFTEVLKTLVTKVDELHADKQKLLGAQKLGLWMAGLAGFLLGKGSAVLTWLGYSLTKGP